MLGMMARIDGFYLEEPCNGSSRMVGYLARDGIPITPDRVRNLMRRTGLRAIYQKQRTTIPGDPSERFLCIVDASHWYGCGSGVGHRYMTHLHPTAERVPLSCGNCGSHFQKCVQLEALK